MRVNNRVVGCRKNDVIETLMIVFHYLLFYFIIKINK